MVTSNSSVGKGLLQQRRKPRTAASRIAGTINNGNATSSQQPKTRTMQRYRRMLLSSVGVICGCCSAYYFTTFDARHEALAEKLSSNQNTLILPQLNDQNVATKPSSDVGVHRVAGLTCKNYGDNFVPEDVLEGMVYWQDIPSDADFKSPFLDENDEKYMTFQPDGGGWNNIRMGMESAVLMAVSMGRTLVLPPEKKMYLIDDGRRGKQKQQFDFNDFFHMESLSEEHKGVSIITMEEFLKREAITGKLTDSMGKVLFPKGNRTDWNGIFLGPLWTYLSTVGVFPGWGPGKCLAAFPASTDVSDIKELKRMMKEIKLTDPPIRWQTYKDNPVDVDAPPIERLKENFANRDSLCIYNKTLQDARLIHLRNGYPHDVSRLLAPFYTFFFFQDWKQDLWSKRFIRDHVRYVDELMCAAARIVCAIRERAKAKNSESNPKGLFNTMHVRRGDFQYEDMRIEATAIYDNIKDTFDEGDAIFVATDEKNKSFFNDLKEHYDIYFLNDFLHLVPDVNTNYYGMLDQIIASKGEIFFGTYYSTFSSYIHRLRGYHATKNKSDGHGTGGIASYYFVPIEHKFVMKKYTPVTKPFWVREFPVSWRDIDRDVE